MDGLFWFRSCYGLFYREIRRFLKVPSQTIGTPIISSLLYLLIFGVSLGTSIQLKIQESYLAFLIPGLTMMVFLKNAFENSSSSIITSKYLNELQDLRIVPVDRFQIALALSLSGLLRGFIVATLTFCMGEIFHVFSYGTWIAISHPLWLGYFILFGGLSFSLFGLSVGMNARSFEHVSAISSFALTPLLYLGGIFFPLSEMHPIWQYISYVNPILYLISGFRFSILGHADVPVETSFFFTFCSLILFMILSINSLSKGRNYFR